MAERNLITTQREVDEPLPPITKPDVDIVKLAAKAEANIAAMERITMYALKKTNANDWVDEGGQPYLQSSGAEKIRPIFGISWRIDPPVKENLDGGHFMYRYTGEFWLGGSSIDVVGTRSSKDPFFKKYEWRGEEGDRTRTELPVSEIDPGDVMKSAYSNLLANGVTRVLGLRNITWEQLEKYAGIKRSQVHTVEFKKHGKTPISQGKAPSSPERKESKQPGSPDEPATMAQTQAIHSIFKSRGIEDELAKMQEVARILGLKEVPTSVSKITKAQASQVIEALNKELSGRKEGAE